MYCAKCGKQLLDEAVICPGCGCMVKNVTLGNPAPTNQKKVQISLILGIIGIVSAWLYALGGHILSIIGIVFGVKEYKETGNMIGLVLSIIGEVCSVISSLIGIIMVFQYL